MYGRAAFTSPKPARLVRIGETSVIWTSHTTSVRSPHCHTERRKLPRAANIARSRDVVVRREPPAAYKMDFAFQVPPVQPKLVFFPRDREVEMVDGDLGDVDMLDAGYGDVDMLDADFGDADMLDVGFSDVDMLDAPALLDDVDLIQ